MNSIRLLNGEFDFALGRITALMHQLGSHLSSPTPRGEQHLHSTIGEANSALDDAHSFVKRKHEDCQETCEKLSALISRLEAESRSFKTQLKELSIKQEATEESIRAKSRDIRYYENRKQDAESEIDRAKLNTIVKTAATIWIPFVGPALALINLKELLETLERLNEEIKSRQLSIDELINQRSMLRNEKIRLDQQTNEVEYERNMNYNKLEQHQQIMGTTTELIQWIANARTAVASIYGNVEVTHRMNNRYVCIQSVIDCVNDVMQIVHKNQGAMTSIASPSVLKQLENEWKFLNMSSIQSVEATHYLL